MTPTPTVLARDPFNAETLTETGPVIVALKPSFGGDRTFAIAHWIAEKTGSELQVVSVSETQDAIPRAAEARYGGATRVDVLRGQAAITIAHTARDRGARIVVVGTGRRHVLGRFLYGDRALEVVRSAVGPVLVAPPTARPPFTHAMVAVDFSQASMRAAVAALGLLGEGGRLSLVHVKGTAQLHEDMAGWWNDSHEQRSRETLARFAENLPEHPGITVQTSLERGEPIETLLSIADERDVDLICCGRLGHSLVERVLVGSVSSALVRRASCAVVVAPERPYDVDPHETTG